MLLSFFGGGGGVGGRFLKKSVQHFYSPINAQKLSANNIYVIFVKKSFGI